MKTHAFQNKLFKTLIGRGPLYDGSAMHLEETIDPLGFADLVR